MTTTIKLELSDEAVNFILQALGELPAKSNAMALIMQIKEQADPQVTPPEEVVEEKTE